MSLNGLVEEKHTKSIGQEKWRPPISKSIKINFDGAFDLHQARSGPGVVAGNSSGEILVLKVVLHKAISSKFAAEAHACFQAILLGLHLDLELVIIEGDSMTTIKKCKSVN